MEKTNLSRIPASPQVTTADHSGCGALVRGVGVGGEGGSSEL